MFVPVVLGSDKTTVSVMTGNTEYYPLYISLGNIHNNVRRAHHDAVTILMFLTIPKSPYGFCYTKFLNSVLICMNTADEAHKNDPTFRRFR